jgi:hypothetical protein
MGRRGDGGFRNTIRFQGHRIFLCGFQMGRWHAHHFSGEHPLLAMEEGSHGWAPVRGHREQPIG